jgi:hypothetical protein
MLTYTFLPAIPEDIVSCLARKATLHIFSSIHRAYCKAFINLADKMLSLRQFLILIQYENIFNFSNFSTIDWLMQN